MDDALVVLKDGILLLGEGIGLQRYREGVGRLERIAENLALRFVDSFDQVGVVVPLLCLLPVTEGRRATSLMYVSPRTYVLTVHTCR